MTIEIGALSLIGALAAALAAAVTGWLAAARPGTRWMEACRWSLFSAAGFTLIAAISLTSAFVHDRFALDYVARYSERAMPVGYKIAAVWAGQEGSLLLWALILSAMCAAAVAAWQRRTGREFAIAMTVMAAVNGLFSALLVFIADPFAPVKAAHAPLDGNGLNPMLQDPSMILHPPLLFTGYAGFTVPFAMLIGVLIAGRRDSLWLGLIRRWLLVSWLFLTAGIVLGAWWAYVELGWGGYWAWDPVENASLLPWLTSTALLHSIIVQQQRGMFRFWNAGLIAASFILCIFGTYLTRSGVIDSVHAFAGGALGTVFLGFLIACLVASAGLIVWRRSLLAPEHRLEALISREGAILLGNVLFTTMMVTTLLGTTFPILSRLFSSQAITIGPAFYNRVVAPMALVIVAVMAVSPVLVLGRAAAARIARALAGPAALTAALTIAVAIVFTANVWALLCTAICALGTFAVIVDFAHSVSARRRNTGEGVVRASFVLIDRDHRRYGGRTAHLGAMLLVIGVVGSSLFNTEQTHQLVAGQSVGVDGMTITLVSLDERRQDNFTAVEATVALTDRDGRTYTLRPQRRFYDAWADQPNSEVAILTTWREDVYLSLAGWSAGGAVTAIQVKVNPLVAWIWIGGIAMVLGCSFSALPRVSPLLWPLFARGSTSKTAPASEPADQPAVAARQSAPGSAS